MRIVSRFLLVLFLSCIFVRSVKSDLIIGNFPGNDQGAVATFPDSGAYSLGLTIGATPIILGNVDLRLYTQNVPVDALLQLRSSVGPQPSNNVLLSFNTQAINPGGFASYSFVPNGSAVLAANTTYWLTLQHANAGPDGLFMASSAPSMIPAGPFATFAGLRSGTPLDQSLNLDGFTDTPSFQVNGTAAVPEPGSLLLVATMLVFGVFSRTRIAGCC